MSIALGVDIGLRGAIALIAADTGALIEVRDMPCRDDGIGKHPMIDVTVLADIVALSGAERAYIEHVSARPGESAVGAFSFGRRAHRASRALSQPTGSPAAFLTPATWKRVIGT